MRFTTPRFRGSRLAVVAGCACAAVLALPAAGNGAVMTVGSDLSAPANVVEDHGADSAFWNVFIGGQAQTMPADGQVTFVRVKGSVLADPTGRANPDPLFHFQVLHPVGGGTVRVMLSSAGFKLPVGGDPQAISGYKPVNLCVHRGDYVDFNDIGGFEWRWGNYRGMPVQVFSSAPDSVVDFYSKDNGTNIGSQWAPQATKQGEELLMQEHLATGPDATDICPGGYAQHIFKGLSIRHESLTISTRKRTAKLHGQCPFPSYGGCRGVLVMKAVLGGSPSTIGGSSFVVKPGYSASFEIKLSRKVLKKIKKAGGVSATVQAAGHDDPKADKRANPGVPVQHKTTTGTVTLRVG